MKEQLMNTAITMWKENGYHNVSLNQICSACHVTKGSFYHHFVNKEDVICYYFTRFLEQYDFNYSKETDSYIKEIQMILNAAAKDILDWDPEMILVILNSEGKNTENAEIQKHFMESKIYSRLVDCCKRGQNKGEINDLYPAYVLIEACMTMLTGVIYVWCTRDKPFDLLERERFEIELILRKR